MKQRMRITKLSKRKLTMNVILQKLKKVPIEKDFKVKNLSLTLISTVTLTKNRNKHIHQFLPKEKKSF